MSTETEKRGDETFCAKKSHRHMKEERYLAGLTEKEKKLFESCMSLLHSIGENGGLEEACEWLEKYAAQQESESKDPQDSQSD